LSDPIDRLAAPQRYAVTGDAVTQNLSLYVERAKAATSGGEAVQIRHALRPSSPLIVLLRSPARTDAARNARPPESRAEHATRGEATNRLLAVYLDPASATVLASGEFRDSLVGKIHMFHETLFIPQGWGRALVGWLGVAMFILAITGIWMWWPRRGSFLQALKFRQSRRESINIHRRFGIIVALPLAMASITGVYLAFQQQLRPLLGSVLAISAEPRRSLAAEPLARPRLDIDRAFALATEGSMSRLVSLSLPTAASPLWRIDTSTQSGEVVSVTVDDASGQRGIAPSPLAGDVFAQWIRSAHTGNGLGFFWSALLFLCGLVPAILFITGLFIWRGRRTPALAEAAHTHEPSRDAARLTQ